MTGEPKRFTPREANQTLPLVKRIVEDILKAGQELRALTFELGEKAEENPEVNRLMDLLDELFEELEAIGCFYKDWNFSTGLVDFPSVIYGKEALLCWSSQEKELLYYHDVEAGYAGRKPIPRELF